MFSRPVVFLDVIAWMRLFSMLEGKKTSLNVYISFMVQWVSVKDNFACFDDLMQIMAIYEIFVK